MGLLAPIHWTPEAEANRLLESDPLALLIGLVLDQQIPMEKAFAGPLELKRRLGSLDAKAIAALEPEALAEIFRTRPALHRFPGSMAKRVQALCGAIAIDYGGNAGAVWAGVASGQELAGRLGKLPGFGEGKVKIMVAVLAKKFGVRPSGWEDFAAGWHTIADVDSAESMAHAREVKRAMKKAAAAEAGSTDRGDAPS
jgi:uncharacterized HhH-GPD family protein